MDELESIGIKAKEASRWIGSLGTNEKNALLKHVAMQIKDNAEYIISENNKDYDNAKANGMSPAMLDRLQLTMKRIDGMTEGLLQVVDLEDPIGEVTSMKRRPNGLQIG
ncbi:MAG: gamma-glutamyl-phosphate reductase, partial [Clostridia bacterium]|nr:gamma-glutamyl-phosphate reductase [Clostridia bacterium]